MSRTADGAEGGEPTASPEGAAVRAWYDAHAAEYADASAIEGRFVGLTAEQQHRLNRFKLWAIEHFPPLALAGRDVLEFGAGHGRLALEHPDVASYTGVDISPALVALGQRRLAEAGLADRARLVAGDCLAFEAPPESFDVVCSLGMFPHVADPAPVLRRMVSLLRPGGWLFIDTHHASPLYDPVRALRFRLGRATGGRVHLASGRGLRRALRDAGLDEVRTVMREYPLLGELYAVRGRGWALALRNWLAARPLFDPLGTDVFAWGRKPPRTPA